ncbi:alpha/beta fold hydrolase [Ponticaulis sp.]|uniref:alpha/beta fold hydrolase n=1 Tax=Ponticaulis sp. TaxID=2020902 RepID=UPI000B6E05DA|nr:alpha/beta fold hydrolase [Ponticaulis sp.]MAI89614.1 alpha/beta hydrolase [Ponticaulis sp.]OUY00639.1 MAG: alpha/beta hydrolase [Hyphomonadaceae bacterium TMED5]|tara:strand:+ start:178731 stop:179627 length:897 start_codon:yes stop_codon:yes gene_type:complete
MPRFEVEQNEFVSFDGARLGLTVWGEEIDTPEYVVVGVHGMNDYANAFHMAAPWWAERGVRTYAYDQRGFGRSPDRGRWPNEDVMREDLRTAVRVAREAHPNAVLSVVGISMGGAVALSTFGREGAPEIDRLILSGPGLRGWGAIPFYQAIALEISTRVRPSWVVTPPRRFVHIEPSDNIEMLQRTWSDPLMQRENRIDQVYGVVSVMESAHDAASNLPEQTFLLYGANDYVVPPEGVRRTSKVLPDYVRTAYYENGYHMLMRDLQAEVVWRDQLSFMHDPAAPLPSGSPGLPWSGEN